MRGEFDRMYDALPQIRRAAEAALADASVTTKRSQIFGAVNWNLASVAEVLVCVNELARVSVEVRINDATSPALESFLRERLDARFGETIPIHVTTSW